MATTPFSLASGSYVQNWTQGNPNGDPSADNDWTLVLNMTGYNGSGATSLTDPNVGAINVNANRSDPNVFAAGGVSEFFGADVGNDAVVALQGGGGGAFPSLVAYMDSTGRQNIRVQFDIRDIDSASDTVQPVYLQYRVSPGAAWTTVFTVADATAPGATAVTNVDVVLPLDATNVGTLEVRFVTTDAPGTDEFVGIDNITISSLPGPTGGPDVITGTPNNDQLSAGAGDDTLNGGGGDDILNGDAGSDNLNGGTGNDTMVGGAGVDLMVGGTGNDHYYVTDTTDGIVEAAGEGDADIVFTTVSYTIPANVEQLLLTGTGQTAVGSAAGELLVTRMAGNTLTGLGGNDVYVVAQAGTIVSEAAAGGYDTIIAEVDYTLAPQTELLVLRGTGLIGTGTASADSFRGEGGPNTFVGLGGDDVYVLGSSGDVVTEGASLGSDSVFSTFSYTLPTEVESLFLTGNLLTGTGNAVANLLSSTGGANTLIGLAGDDTYVVNATGDVVIEAAGAAGGYDTVVARANYTMPANVELLALVGTGLTATGSSVGDQLVSIGSGNTLLGGGGDDFLLAGSGGDTLTGGVGGDAFAFRELNGGAPADRFIVTDFNASTGDGVDLSRIDANNGVAGDQAFTIVTAFSMQAGQLTIDQTSTPGFVLIRGDVNGDGIADFVLDLGLAAGGTYSSGNIFL